MLIGPRALASFPMLRHVVAPEPLPDDVRMALLNLISGLAAELDVAAGDKGSGIGHPALRELDQLLTTALDTARPEIPVASAEHGTRRTSGQISPPPRARSATA